MWAIFDNSFGPVFKRINCSQNIEVQDAHLYKKIREIQSKSRRIRNIFEKDQSEFYSPFLRPNWDKNMSRRVKIILKSKFQVLVKWAETFESCSKKALEAKTPES